MFNKMKKNNKGFTLVELLVVIAIIGILAVVAVPSLMKNIDKAKAADIVADYSTIKSVVISQHTDGTLKDGTYTKSKNSTQFVKASSTDSIDVDDLSKEPTYTLEVETDTDTTVTLTINVPNTTIEAKVADQLGVNDVDKTDKTITIDILK